MQKPPNARGFTLQTFAFLF